VVVVVEVVVAVVVVAVVVVVVPPVLVPPVPDPPVPAPGTQEAVMVLGSVAQWNPATQPQKVQSPEWHVPSAPQVKPAPQSAGWVHEQKLVVQAGDPPFPWPESPEKMGHPARTLANRPTRHSREVRFIPSPESTRRRGANTTNARLRAQPNTWETSKRRTPDKASHKTRGSKGRDSGP
jgi:hypothetical protein